MGWTAPATYATNQLINAADLNLIRDNLNYLKGNAGTVAFAAALTVAGGVVATAGTTNQDILSGLSGASGNFAGISVGRTASEARFAIPGAATQFFSGAAAGDAVFRVDDAAKRVLLGAGSTETLVIQASTINQPFTAKGPASISMALLAATAVGNTLQTLAPAGTVSSFALFYLMDYNNTGGAIVPISGNGLKPSQTFTVVNTDTITVTLTAGGAITVQRTAGANATHEMAIFVLYK